MNELTYIAVAIRDIDRAIRVRVVWRALREGSGSPRGGEYTRARDVVQNMEHAAKWCEGDNHLGEFLWGASGRWWWLWWSRCWETEGTKGGRQSAFKRMSGKARLVGSVEDSSPPTPH